METDLRTQLNAIWNADESDDDGMGDDDGMHELVPLSSDSEGAGEPFRDPRQRHEDTHEQMGNRRMGHPESTRYGMSEAPARYETGSHKQSCMTSSFHSGRIDSHGRGHDNGRRR